MSFQPSFPGLFSQSSGAEPVPSAPPKPSAIPATQKQIGFALKLAARHGTSLPDGIAENRAALSNWIDTHNIAAPTGKFSNYPSSKQVAFAERIARLRRNPVPPECFRDRGLMSRWIDSNKPR